MNRSVREGQVSDDRVLTLGAKTVPTQQGLRISFTSHGGTWLANPSPLRTAAHTPTCLESHLLRYLVV